MFLGTVLHFLDDPGPQSDASTWELFEDGALVVNSGGKVTWTGPAAEMPDQLRTGATVVDHRGRLIVPGFVDTHLHVSEVDIVASYGEQLLNWLQQYAFPAEARCADPDYARTVSGIALEQMLAAGTTTASVHTSIHPTMVNAFFEQALQRNLRMLSGKVLMDRIAQTPHYLRDAGVQTAEDQTTELINRWHGRGRLGYSISPRLALTCTEDMLAMVARLHSRQPDLRIQTHGAENPEEIKRVLDIYRAQDPSYRSYIDIYDRFGLLTDKSLFAHCVHIDDTDRVRLAATGSAVAFCPDSNMFLGSGLFDLDAAWRYGINVGLGSDIAGGTSYSLLYALNQAYKVVAVRGGRLPALRGFYLATLGGARALSLDRHIGNFTAGKEADFTVLDFTATPTLARRTEVAETFLERLFALMILGDEQAVTATYILGQRVSQRSSPP
ncbi:guanine deaminase [Streptomyces sp. NPDC023327]|uniref:guanine deaminase n=1 Tax=Streptomyces sp. NPDC023327 TaxID=3157088 RepID=UPI0033C9D60B